MTVRGDGIEAAAEWGNLMSPENYLAPERTRKFASNGGAVRNTPRTYAAPGQLRLNHWALAGNWTMRDQAIVLHEAGILERCRIYATDLSGEAVRKAKEGGCENILLTERGTFFGYHRLVNDFTGLGDLMELDCAAFTDAGSPPVCFDITHSTQLPGSGEQTGGRPERAPPTSTRRPATPPRCARPATGRPPAWLP